MQEVEAVCDHVIIINKGKIVADDSLQNLKNINNATSLESIFVKLTHHL
jgi:ABC-2 type transport system ATP-binding protein